MTALNCESYQALNINVTYTTFLSEEPYASYLEYDKIIPVYRRACQVLVIVSVLQSPYTLLQEIFTWPGEL